MREASIERALKNWPGMTCSGFSSRGYTPVPSCLSEILQTGVDAKYYLSSKACIGILRRAAVRGKELPEVLRLALERQAAQEV